MNATKSCPICNTLYSCCCKSSLVQLFALLGTASQRVLSEKQSSISRQIELKTAGIDKLNGYFLTRISKAEIVDASKGCGLTVKRTFLKDKKAYLEISNNNSRLIHLRLGFSETEITNFVTNPNRFHNWIEYQKFIASFIPNEHLINAKVSRLDLNIDFNCEFTNLIQHIDVIGKRKSLSFQDESGLRTGLTIGKEPETVVIYDKTNREKLAYPLTRIELRLSKDKLPTKSLLQIPMLLANRQYFANLAGINVSYSSKPLIKAKEQRISDFKSILNRDGFYSAKKAFNTEGNFNRDFSNALTITKWQTPISELFQQKIKQFINPIS